MNDDLAFRMFAERRHRRQRDRWLALALTLSGIAFLSNAIWFYNWRVRAVAHHAELEQARRVEYVEVEARPESRPTPAVYQVRAGAGRKPQGDERCVGGVIVRRSGNGLESSGERCVD